MKNENSKKITTLGVVIFSFVALCIFAGVLVVVDAITALLVLKTSLPEGALTIGNVIGCCFGTIAGAYFLAFKGRLKGIYSALIVGGFVVALKIVGNLYWGMGGYLSWRGMIGIIFVAVFALVGGTVGALTKR